MKVKVVNVSGKTRSSLTLPKEVFGVTVKPRLLSQAVRVYLSNQRQGTRDTQGRGEVAGSGRKIWRQKGTGRARHGDRQAPLFVGGGVAHGPKPGDHSLKLLKKMRRLAVAAALTYKAKKENLVVVDKFNLAEVKTRNMLKLLTNIASYPQNKKILVILPKVEKDWARAARNLPGVKLSTASGVNVYSLLASNLVVMTPESIKLMAQRGQG